MCNPVIVPGLRDVRGSLDRAQNTDKELDIKQGDGATTAIIACPPHPKQGGSRHDKRLQIVSDAASNRGIDCLRFDYGSWEGGRGEIEDTRNAICWAATRYKRIAIFGYSFGGAIALLAASDLPCEVEGVSVLAPAAQITASLDAVTAVRESRIPIQVICGSKDTTVDWKPIAKEVEKTEHELIRLPTDHSFIGQRDQIVKSTAQFFDDVLRCS